MTNGIASLQYEGFFAEFAALKERVKQLEKIVEYPQSQQNMTSAVAPGAAFDTAIKEAAVRAQANQPLTNDVRAIRDLGAFARRLLNPEDLGYAVTAEVRNEARRALGLPEVKEYDL